ncbi:MAG: hypothetical protein KF861_23315, partial [Planctomycetaceae bacterium]|nr:hypothetical protein [Planctomycetaceae bacterium]
MSTPSHAEHPVSRRTILGAGIASTLAATAIRSTPVFAAPAGVKKPASERIQVGCIGAAGRAGALVRTFSQSPQADVVAIADLDPARLADGLKASEEIQGFRPRGEKDFR